MVVNAGRPLIFFRTGRFGIVKSNVPQGSLNLRGYWEFAAQNRSSGWNTWLVFSIAPTGTAERTPIVVK